MRNRRERAVCACAAGITSMHHVTLLYVTSLLAKGQRFAAAAAPAEWPGETAADQQPPARTPATPDWHTLGPPQQISEKRGVVVVVEVGGGGWIQGGAFGHKQPIDSIC